jgi:uncharacterized protein
VFVPQAPAYNKETLTQKCKGIQASLQIYSIRLSHWSEITHYWALFDCNNPRSDIDIKITTMLDNIINDFNVLHLIVICCALFSGGFVKGTSSFGLPTVSIPILITVFPLPTAVSVLAVPLVLSNVYQMVVSGGIRPAIKRHWILYLSLFISLPIGVYLLGIVDVRTLIPILGVVLVVVTSLELLGISLTFMRDHEKAFSPVIGIFSGIVGGMTTLFAILPIFFLVALGLDKDRFVSAVSVMLCFGSIVLAASLQRTDHLGTLEVTYGIIGMIPIILGIWLGTKIRNRVNQAVFRKIILSLILIVGISMIYRSRDILLGLLT